MARASSVISVSIIGDAKKLIAATKTADAATGGLVKSGLKTFGLLAGAGIGIDKAFDFVQDSVKEADRLGDATSRLNRLIGKADTQKLAEMAENFHNIGLSKQDVLELGANFATVVAPLELNPGLVGDFADDVAATAAAMSLVDAEGRDPSVFVDLIGKAAGGAAKPLKELGISLSDSEVEARALKDSGKDLPGQLTDTEKATARLHIIMEKLAPVLRDAAGASTDVETKQRDLQAQTETLAGKLGEELSPALNDVLGFLLHIASHDWGNDFARIAWGVGEILTPIARANDGLQTLIGLLHEVARLQRNVAPARSGHRDSDRDISDAQRRQQERNGLGT